MNLVQKSIMKSAAKGNGSGVSLSSGHAKYAGLLVERGWLDREGDHYTITDTGRRELDSPRSSRVYAYRAYQPTDGGEDFDAQIAAAHKLKNRLVEIERIRRQKHDELLADQPEVLAIEKQRSRLLEELEVLRGRIKQKNCDRRSKREAMEETMRERDRAGGIKRSLKTLGSDLKSAKSRARDLVRPQLDEDVAEANRLIDEAVKASGCYWGTTNALKLTVKRSGPPPRFRRFDGSGKLDCQIIGGLSAQQIYQGGRNIGVEMKGKKWGELTMRVGTVGSGRDARGVFVTLPKILHRPIREDARIKSVAIVRERIACRHRFGVRILMDADSWDKPDWAGDGEVGVDVGWRLVGGGLRVAYWVGSDGREGELILPEEMIGRWSHCETVQSERKRAFNSMRDRLMDWIDRHFDAVEYPEWFIRGTENIGSWLSPERLGRLAAKWKAKRFAGDIGIAAAIEGWRSWDQERWLHESLSRERAINWRNEQYQQFAVFLRRKYATAFIEDTDWKKMQDLPEAEEKQPQAGSRDYRAIASPGILSQKIMLNLKTTAKRPAQKSTMVHHDCGELSGQPDRAALSHVCQRCGVSFDQDRNAAMNLLRGTHLAIA